MVFRKAAREPAHAGRTRRYELPRTVIRLVYGTWLAWPETTRLFDYRQRVTLREFSLKGDN